MSRSIRPLERADVPRVAALYEMVARSGSRTPPPGLVPHFEESFLDHPWADPEIPSLVYEDEGGELAGFLGSHVRRMRFGERSVRLGCSGHLVTEPEARNRAVGAFLMRAYMSGPQELTFTDTASPLIGRIWESLGGEKSQLGCVGWIRLFRPFRAGTELVSRRRGIGPLARASRPLWPAIDAATAGAARSALATAPVETAAEDLDPSAIAEHVERVAGAFALRPEYEDEKFVRWLLGAVASVSERGELVARLVRAEGRVLGWYVYYLRPRGIAQVLQVAAGRRDVGAVLDQLLEDARSRGASAAQGRMEPHLFDALTSRRCVLHASGYLALIHSRDPALLHAVQAGPALLTRLEGEWWMGHHARPFGGSWTGEP